MRGPQTFMYAPPAAAGLTSPLAADFDAGSHKITNLADPSAAGDGTNKGYVDAIANGVDWKGSCRLATAASPATYTRSTNVITFSAVGSQSVDGSATVLSDRILLKNGAAGADNGLYSVTTKGTGGVAEVWTRTTDADASAEVTAGLAVFIEEGTVNADTGWVLTTNATITLNTTALTFTQFTSLGQITAGNGLSKTAATLSIDTAITADLTTAQTLTNKRKTDRVNSQTNVGTLTPNSDSYDLEKLTAQAQNLTIANPSGTPTDGQKIEIRIAVTAAATRDVAFGNQYRGSTDLALPGAASLILSKTHYLLFEWNSGDSKWDYIGKTFGF